MTILNTMRNFQQQLGLLGQSYHLPEGWLIERPHLLSDANVTLSAAQANQIRAAIHSIEHVIALPAYQQHTLAQAPAIAQYNPGNTGVLFGYDFHLTTDGVKLIEINTNASGAFLTALLYQAYLQTDQLSIWQQRLLAMFFNEWRMKRGTQTLRRIAIVDHDPCTQFLYPDMLICQSWLQQHNIDCVIVDPQQLTLRGQQLYSDELPIDLIYNRLTDFMLAEPEHAVLAQAYQADAVVLTPHPYAHALYANKINLAIFSNAALLQQWGAANADIITLQQAIPHTIVVTPEQADSLWHARKQLFFKPLAGYASKGVYRGGTLTHRVFTAILQGDYIAQEYIPASERYFSDQLLKIDLRAYVYQSEVLGFVARLYQGQVTNMRTTGGGFATILVENNIH